jgi:N-acetylglucosaminyldiphosphoundecaprenol N-acetyl-beta-D-mannosaminyltransferase
MSEKLNHERVLGIGITTAPKAEVLEYILTGLVGGSDPYYIVTPNPEQITRCQYDAHAMTLLNDAQVSLPDGIGVVWASKMLGGTIKTRISGIEFMQDLCKESVRKRVTIGFLGGRGEVAEETANRLSQKYPGMDVVYAQDEWDEKKMIRKHIDILFVGFGFPKQEEWMSQNIGKVPVKVMMAVGGSFDVLSGRLPRAPQFMRVLGLEWLFRLVIEPWRWKRQMSLLKFVSLVLRERFRS